MLKLEKITARAGAFTLKPVDLEIPEGECHALLGPSGSGKSTLLELIVGFQKSEAGEIFMNGGNLSHVPVEKRGMGYLPQKLALFPHLTVMENILYGVRCLRKPDQTDLFKVNALLESLGLARLKDRRPQHLSGGERQRVALARALAPEPRLLILDEPFSALNQALRRELWGLLSRLQKKIGVTTLMVTHDLDEAFFFGEKIHVLINGTLHQSGERRCVFNRPATLEVARFLGIPNLFSGRVTARTPDHTLIACESLRCQMMIDNSRLSEVSLTTGCAVTIGIRSECVAVTSPSLSIPPGTPCFKGKVIERSETLSGFILTVRPDGGDEVVTLAISAKVAEAINPPGIEIYFPIGHLFFISSKYIGKSF